MSLLYLFPLQNLIFRFPNMVLNCWNQMASLEWPFQGSLWSTYYYCPSVSVFYILYIEHYAKKKHNLYSCKWGISNESRSSHLCGWQLYLCLMWLLCWTDLKKNPYSMKWNEQFSAKQTFPIWATVNKLS